MDLTIEERVAKLEEQMKSILEGHEGGHRDDIKADVDKLKAEADAKKASEWF